MEDRTRELLSTLDAFKLQQEFFYTVNLEPGRVSSARIVLQNHELNITFVDDWYKRFGETDTEVQRFLSKLNIAPEDAVKKIIRDFFLHEIGHRSSRRFSGCPETAQNNSKCFLEPVYDVLKIENKKQLAYFANCVTDIINNAILYEVTSFAGWFLFYKEQSTLCGGKFSKLYEALVRLNLVFCGNKAAYRLLRPHFTYDKELNQAIKNFLERTGISRMRAEYASGAKPVVARDKDAIRKFMMDKDNWALIAKVYAEEFGKFFDKDQLPKERLMGAGGACSGSGDSDSENSDRKDDSQHKEDSDKEQGKTSGDDESEDENDKSEDKNDSGNDSKDGENQEDSDKEQGKTSGDDESKDENDSGGDDEDSEEDMDSDDGAGGSSDSEDDDLPNELKQEFGNTFGNEDGFGSELNNSDILKRIIRTRAGLGPGWVQNFEYLVGLYEMLALDKVLELSIPPVEAKSFPLIGMGQKRFDPESDPISSIRGIHYDFDTKQIEFTVQPWKLPVVARVLPELSILDIVVSFMDTSSSMLGCMPENKKSNGAVVNPKAPAHSQWRFNSKYHVCLLFYFMLVKRLSDLHIYDSDAYFVNFSNNTQVSRGLRRSLIEALCPQFGGTTLIVEKVKILFNRFNQLIVMISDGEIGNWKETAKLIQASSKFNLFVHVQIGSPSDFSKWLQKHGFEVVMITSEDSLYNLAIDLTEKYTRIR